MKLQVDIVVIMLLLGYIKTDGEVSLLSGGYQLMNILVR